MCRPSWARRERHMREAVAVGGGQDVLVRMARLRVEVGARGSRGRRRLAAAWWARWTWRRPAALVLRLTVARQADRQQATQVPHAWVRGIARSSDGTLLLLIIVSSNSSNLLWV